jgi:hypothetical protein
VRRLGSNRGLLLLAAATLALCVGLPTVSDAAKKRHAHAAKLKRKGGCQIGVLPASTSVRPFGSVFVSGKSCAKSTVKLQQASASGWLGLGKATANRNGAYSSCVTLRDGAAGSSVQLRAVASDGSKALATLQLSSQGTDSCSPTPAPTAASEPPTTVPPTTTTPPPSDPPPADPPPTTPPPSDPPPTTPPPTEPPPTTPPPVEVPSGMHLLKEDLATDPDPMSLWGDIDAVSPTRHQWFASGGPEGGPFRRMTALDGDLYHGDSERAELGNSSYQLTSAGKLKTFFLYREGERRITSYWMRLPTDFPLYDMENWQVVMQMKQSEPATNADGTPVIALQAIEGNWILKQSSSSGLSESTRYLWTTPAGNALGNWTHIVVDATYSSDPSKGLFQITIGGVASQVFHMYDLKKEIIPAGPGLRAGDSIPSHLRLGIYHDPSMPGTHVDIADVQVFG